MDLRGKYRAIIFDLDGVVIDSEPLHEKATRRVIESRGAVVPEAGFAEFKGLPDPETFELAIRKYGMPVEDLQSLVDAKQVVYHGLLDELQPVDGALEFIRLASSKFDLALTTSSEEADAKKALAMFGLDGAFSVVVTAADVTRRKPDPRPYLVTMERMGHKSSECLIIEDSVNGIRSATAAGCDVAGLTTTFEPSILQEAGALVVVDRLDELAEMLGLGGV